MKKIKVPSGEITNLPFLKHLASFELPLILSTGMSTNEEIDHAIEVLGTEDLIILHCTSTYPSEDEELNIRVMQEFQKRFPDCPIGYSGHETGVIPSVISVVLGAPMVERHITLNRAMWGSDQAASLEPHGLELLCKYIRSIPIVMGDGQKMVYDREKPIISKLRRVKSPVSPV